MTGNQRIDVIIPARNEEDSLPKVLTALAPLELHSILVVDNGSTDDTARVAREGGARVVEELQTGYGSACLAGLDKLRSRSTPPDVVVFLDADFSDDPTELPLVAGPVLSGEADLVIGSRVLGRREPGALLPQARFGNWLSARLIRLFFGLHVTDLGPFRAIRWSALESLAMADRDFGWTVEMQVKAARANLRYREVPVSYRRRIGVSKITGTVRGTILAGVKILYTIFRYAIIQHRALPKADGPS